MCQPHDYDHLDKDNKISLEIDLKELAERVNGLNHGTHRFLSHLIDVRRSRLINKIIKYKQDGSHSVADYVERTGDKLADGIEKLLMEGLY